MLGRIGMRVAHMDQVHVKYSRFTYPGVWTGNFRNAANDIIRVTAHHFGISRRVLRFPRPNSPSSSTKSVAENRALLEK